MKEEEKRMKALKGEEKDEYKKKKKKKKKKKREGLVKTQIGEGDEAEFFCFGAWGKKNKKKKKGRGSSKHKLTKVTKQCFSALVCGEIKTMKKN